MLLDDLTDDKPLTAEQRDRLRDWYTRDLPFGFVRAHL